jgi:TRAP-type uncharacterized transport system substrate-binding protein
MSIVPIARISLAALSLGVALITTTSPAAAQTMGLATMQPGTLNHTTGTAIAKVAKEKAGLNTLVQPTAGESVIIPLVGRGRPSSASPMRWKCPLPLKTTGCRICG